jgi:formylglycine-generating enzyme required for sulfatase activity
VRAAGGEQNTRYPWDAVNPKSQLPTSNLKSLISNVVARANVRESEIGDTTPVAMYPDGVRVTEKGDPIWDLAGNVWEWTSTLYGGYEGAYVRGGSWYNKADDVSISSRDLWPRGFAVDYFGLRVVVASPNFPP